MAVKYFQTDVKEHDNKGWAFRRLLSARVGRCWLRLGTSLGFVGRTGLSEVVSQVAFAFYAVLTSLYRWPRGRLVFIVLEAKSNAELGTAYRTQRLSPLQ